jgi:hypothetical protein
MKDFEIKANDRYWYFKMGVYSDRVRQKMIFEKHLKSKGEVTAFMFVHWMR